VGPDYTTPPVSLSKTWLEADDQRVKTEPTPQCWWEVFNDPTLNRLIETAYRENLSLEQAGTRVLEARAQLGIAIGQWYPQQQQAFGSLERIRTPGTGSSQGSNSLSSTLGKTIAQTAVQNTVGGLTTGTLNRIGLPPPNQNRQTNAAGAGGTSSTGGTQGTTASGPLKFTQANLGLTASWEIDFWGRFRRNIESADASLMASLADYDNALVSLTADVADTYIFIRTMERRLVIARENVKSQRESLQIAQARFKGGTTTERDVQQARTQWLSTQAMIPVLEIQLQHAKNALSVLLAMPPSSLEDILQGPHGIPVAPVKVAVGIPAELLRRRPDIRSAELNARAQSAQIGVAAADLLPAFSLIGTFGFQSNTLGSSTLGDLFKSDNTFASAGPGFTWNFLNYGRIINNVRVQDARFQQLLLNYQNTVLNAQREVEDALTGFLNYQQRTELLTQSTRSAHRSLELAVLQYRQGTTDFTTVLSAQQALLVEQDNLADSLGNISRNLVLLYRALGGGWEIREGQDVVSEKTKEEMAKRTCWGKLLQPVEYISREPEKIGVLPPLPDW
jgi:NodT family efflux transporter outer membrane factor (OMF) lipoprotein